MTPQDLKRIEQYTRATQTLEPPKEGHDVELWNQLAEPYRLGYNLEYFQKQALKDIPKLLEYIKEITQQYHFDLIVAGEWMMYINPPGIDDKPVYVHSKKVYEDGGRFIQISSNEDFSLDVLPSQLRFPTDEEEKRINK